MASGFNLTAQLNLQGPTNVASIVKNIKQQIGNINANVNVNVSNNTTGNITKLTSSLTNLNSVLNNTSTNANNAAQAIRALGQAIGQANNPLNNLQQNLQNNATAAAQLVTNLTTLRRNTQQCGNQFEEFGRQSAIAVRRFAAMATVTSIIYKFGNSLDAASKEFIEFNKELVRVAQVTDTGLSGLDGLVKEITGLSVNLGVASNDLIKVSSTLAQAGLSARDTEKALKALALSALAPSFDSLNDTVEGSIALMRQFNIGAGDLEGALGSVNAVAAKFAVEAGDIITAIQRTGGVFATASKGVSEGKDALNEFIAVFTSIRATTRESAETISTGLRTIFTRLQRKDTIDALKQFGVVLTDLEGKFVGPYEASRRLSEGLSKLDPRDLKFSQIVEELGGFRQIGKVIPLIQQFATAQEALKVAQQGQGSLAKDAAIAQESVANKMTKVREEFIALVRSIGESQGFQTFIKLTLDLTSSLIKLADAAKGIMPALLAIGTIRGAGAAVSFGRGFVGGLRRHEGGSIPRFASGGFVPGQGNGDTVPAMLTPGEFVIRKKAVKAIGADRLAGMNKYAGGGIVDDLDKGVGAAILEYKQGSESEQFKVKINGANKTVKGTKQGLNEKTYSSFDNALNEGIRRGVNYATRIVSKDLGISSKQVDKGEEQKRFLAGINDGTRGNLFEDILRTMRKDSDAFSLTDKAQRPFDFPNGLSGTLKDNYDKLPAKWIDAKASFDAARNSLQPKTQRQIDIELGATPIRQKGMELNIQKQYKLEELKKSLGAKNAEELALKGWRKTGSTAYSYQPSSENNLGGPIQEFAKGGMAKNKDSSDLLLSMLQSHPFTYSPTSTISKLLKTEGAENSLKAIQSTYGVQSAKIIGSGAESVIFDIGKQILKISQGGNYNLPKGVSGIAGYGKVKQFGQLTAALQEKLNTDKIGTSKDVALLQKKIGKKGFNWSDAHELNIGYDNKGRPKILDGSIMPKYAKGGSPQDTVPALLTPGEFVINKKAASRIGLSTLHKMNHADKVQGFNKGGAVQGFASGGLIGAGLKLGSFALRRGLSGLNRWRGSTGTGLSGGSPNAESSNSMLGLAGLMGGQMAISHFASQAGGESEARGRAIQDIGGGAATYGAVGSEIGRAFAGRRGGIIGGLAGAAYGGISGYGQTSKTKLAYDEKTQQELINKQGEDSGKGIEAYIKTGKEVDRKIAMLKFERLQQEESKGSSQLTKKEGETSEAFTQRLQKIQEQGATQAKDILFNQMKKTGKTFEEVSKSMNPQELEMLTRNIAETDSEYIQLQQQKNIDIAGLRASGANKAADDLEKTYNNRLAALSNTLTKRQTAELDASMQAERLSKEAKRLFDAMRKSTMSIETTFNAIGQAIDKTSFNISQASSRGEEIISGKINGVNPFERNVNILKNPSAYSAAERQSASSSNGLLGNQTKLVNDIAKLSESKNRAIGVGIASEKKADSTKESIAGDVVRQLTSDIEAVFGPNSTASQTYISAIVKQKEAVLEATKDTQDFDIESFVESVSGPLNAAAKQAGELQIQSQQVLSKVFMDLSKLGEELSNIQQTQINRIKQFISVQSANNNNMKESLGIRTSLSDRNNERSNLAANRLGFQNSNISSKMILGRYASLQQGRAVAESDKNQLGKQLGSDAKISQKFIAASNNLANFNAEIKNVEQEISNLPKVLQDNLDDVFGEMRKRTALIAASKQAGGDFAARLVTSTPQELRELSDTFNVMNNAVNGNVSSIQQSQSAQKAYYEALMDGKNMQEAVTDAQKAFANQNRDALSLFKDLADIAGVEGPAIDAMKANMLESFGKSQGMENFQPLQMMIAKLRETPTQTAQKDTVLKDLQNQAQILMQSQVEAVKLANEIDREQQARLLTEVGDKIIKELQAAPIQIQVAVQNMSNATGGLPVPQTKSKGGMIYASRGTYVNYEPKGTDTVPAMLTPGEFVVNARSTAKNLPLLKSINKADGGTVSRSGKFQTVSGSKANIDFRGRMSHLSNGGKVAYLAKGGFGIDWDTFAPNVNDPAKPAAKPNQFTVNPNASGAEDLITNTNQTQPSKKTGWGNWFQSIRDKYKAKSEEAKPLLDAMKKQDRAVGAKIGKGASKLIKPGIGAAAGFVADPLARLAVGAAGGGEEAQNNVGNIVQGGVTVAGGVGSATIGAVIEATQNLTAEQRQAKYERERTANDTRIGAFSETFANPLGGILRVGRAIGQNNEAQTNAANLESETLAKSRPEYRAKVIAEAQANDRRLEAEARAKQNEAEKGRGLSEQDVAGLRNIRMGAASPDNRLKPSPAQLEKEAKIKAGWTWDEFDQVWVPPVKSKPAGVKPPPGVLAKQKRGEALAFGRAGQTGFSAVTGTIGAGTAGTTTQNNTILPQSAPNKNIENTPANPEAANMFFGGNQFSPNMYGRLNPYQEAVMRNIPLSQVQDERRKRMQQMRMAPYLKRKELANTRYARMQEMQTRNKLLYKQSGGSIPYTQKGTDIVPAMLSKGEYVVNKNATQKNIGLLENINRGYSNGGVIYRQNGGPVGPVAGSQSMDGLAATLNNFVQQMKEVLPSSVGVEGKHDVNVIINGAAILQNVLAGPLGELVKKSIEESFMRKNRQNEGS